MVPVPDVDLSDPVSASPWRGAALRLARWTVGAVLYALVLHLQISLPMRIALFQAAVYCYSLMLILIPVGHLSARLMVRPRSLMAITGAHLAMGTAAVSVWQGLMLLYYRTSIGPYYWDVVYSSSWMFQLLSALTTYGTVLGFMLASQGWARERERERREAALIVAARDAELAAIKTQFQPHFVLNALNSLLALIDRNPALARTMVVRLADLMTAVFDRIDVTEVPLEREIDLARAYLDVERIRLGARLTASFDVDDDARGVMVPPFLLQPLVENAVKHGVAPHARPGRVSVSASRANDRLQIRIADSGETPPTGFHRGASTGRGLQITRRRLDSVYADAYQLKLEHDADGTTVYLDLPGQSVDDMPLLLSRRTTDVA